MKAKAEARWAQIVKDPRTNERFQEYMKGHNVQSQEQAKALQTEFVKKLQADMIDQIRHESRAGMASQFRKQAQEELIEERLKLQEAKKLGVEINDDDVKRMLQGIADRNKMTIDQFAQQVKSTGFDISTLRERLRGEQAWREAIRRRFGAQINITQKDVDRMLSAAATETGEDAFELQVQKITLPIQGRADQSTLARRYSEAQALHSKADGCKNMAGLVKEATDAQFEDSKYVRPANLPEPTRSMLLLAKDGDVLPPATQANSIDIYAVCGRRPVKGDEKTRDNALQELQQKEFNIVAKRHLFDLRQEAHIEYR
jgi:peptidyl-prolyl cis-trans isomerase SurA